MISLLKEVGRGKRGARDLTYEEALQAAESILTGTATPVQIGAFLAAERIKMESVEEIRAFIDTYRSHSKQFPVKGSFDSAGPYDGRNRSFMATLASSFVLSTSGVPAVLHGSPSLPPKWGVTFVDVLHEMGIETGRLSQETWIKAAGQSGFLFVPTEQWCPPLASIRPVRIEMGLRTVYNSVEKLLRPTDAHFMAVGVFHGTVFEKMARMLIELGVQKGIIIQGMEGSEDLAVDRKTRTYLVHDGTSELFIIDPELLELDADCPEKEWTAQEQAAVTLSVLRGEAETPFMNMVLLNSAVRLWIAGKANSIEEGAYKARHILAEGLALEKYNRWTESLKEQIMQKP